MSPLFGTLVATPKINLCPVPPAVDGLYYHSAADETNFVGKIRFMPLQLREIGFHVENYATQWHPFQHEIKNREIVVAWIQLTLKKKGVFFSL